jgi:hypothetical protein
VQSHPPMGTVAAVANSLTRNDVVHTVASVGPACICCLSEWGKLHRCLTLFVQWLNSFSRSYTRAAQPWHLLRTIDVVDGGCWCCCQHRGHCCWPHRLTTNAHVAQAAQQWLATARLKQWLTDGRHEAGADDTVLLNQRRHSLHILQLLRWRHDNGTGSGDANPEVQDMHICKQKATMAQSCQPSG